MSNHYSDEMRIVGNHRSASQLTLHRGFSLIELMVAIALLAILSSLAAPSFNQSIARYRVDSAREAMIASIQLARVEAIRQGREIRIRRSVAGCQEPFDVATVTDWSCGWVSFIDLNNNGVQNAATEPSIEQVQQPRNVLIENNAGAVITINRFGQFGGFGSFAFSGTSSNTTVNQVICINAGSRIRTFRDVTACPP